MPPCPQRIPGVRRRPSAWSSQSAVAVVRAGSAAVRGLQSGFVRGYAALLLVGATGVVFYFLLQS